MRFPNSLRLLSGLAIMALLVGAAFLTRDRWVTMFSQPEIESHAADSPPLVEEPMVLKLSLQARRNPGLVAKPARPQNYWRTIQVPGRIVDRPGQSDRGVTSPAEGVVSDVHAFPDDTVRPGDRLFTIRLFSECLQSTQKQLFSATREAQIAQEQLARLCPLADQSGITKTKIIDLENEFRRQKAVIQAHRQDLLTRGLNPQQVDRVADGEFVSTVEVVAPPRVKDREKFVANDGSVTPGLYLAQSAAASRNRVLKAQAASGMRADVHVHADGSIHASH